MPFTKEQKRIFEKNKKFIEANKIEQGKLEIGLTEISYKLENLRFRASCGVIGKDVFWERQLHLTIREIKKNAQKLEEELKRDWKRNQ